MCGISHIQTTFLVWKEGFKEIILFNDALIHMYILMIIMASDIR